MSDTAEQDAARRLAVAAAAVRLYAERGYEATSADQIAAAAGLSRSTFFRQFRSKEDVVFADHDTLLEQAEAFLAAPHEDPWGAVCEAAGLVFGHFEGLGDLAQLRYRVVNRVPSLRDKELVTTFRYERLFERYLRHAVPGLPALDAVRFAATVIATHNYCLRGLVRGEAGFDAARLSSELDAVRRLFRVAGSGDVPGPGSTPSRPDDIVVAVFPRSARPVDVARRIQRTLEQH